MFQILESTTTDFYDEPVVFTSNIGLPIELVIALSLIFLFLVVVIMMANWKIFIKANKTGISSVIPIYNLIIYFQIVSMPAWQVMLLFVPGINLYFIVLMSFKLAKAFNRSTSFGVGILFLPFIFLPILAFSNIEYFGINSLANTIVLKDRDKEEMDDKTVDQHALSGEGESKGIVKNTNISMGSSFTTYVTPTMGVIGEEKMIENSNNNSTYVNFRVEAQPAVEVKPEEVKEEEAVVETVNTGFTILEPVLEPIKQTAEPNKTYINMQSSLRPRVDESNLDSRNLSFIAPIDNLPAEVVEEKIVEKVENKVLGIPNVGAMAEEDPNFVTCPKCGTKIKKGAARCFICGEVLQ